MIPILFNKDEKTFTSLGLGQMDATLVEVERERNGNYTLYAEVPFNSPQAKQLTKEMLIKADAGSRTKWQTFKINRTIKDTNADIIKVYADHISMDTINDAMKPKVAIRQQTAEGALRQWVNSLVSGKAYDVQSDITHIGSTEWTIDEVENARQALGGVQGSILDVWGGEYEFDNNRIILHKEMGRTAPTVLEYGRNIVSLEYEELIDGVYTSIYPYATYTPKSEDNKQLPDIMVTLDELIVDSEYAGNYETRRIQIVDFSNEFDSNAENPEIPTQAKLRTLATAYVKNNGYGIPKISQEIDFVDLSKTLDYQDIQVMEEIELNDRVPVYYPNIDAETNDVKVTTTNWDVLNNRYSKITLSTIGAMNTNSITSKLNTAIKDLKAEQKKINNTVPYLINGQGNRVWHTTPDENMEHKIDDTWFKKNGKYTIIYRWNGSMWEEVLNDETFITEIEAGVSTAIEEVEKAVQSAQEADARASEAIEKAGANASLLSTHQNTLDTIKNTTIPNVNKVASDAMTEAKSALSSASSAMTEAQKADGKIADYVTKNGLVSGTTVDSKIDTATGEISKKITTVESKIPTSVGGRNYLLNSGKPTALNINSNNGAVAPLTKGVENGIDWITQENADGFVITTYIQQHWGMGGVFGNTYSKDLEGYKGDITYSVDVMSPEPITIGLGTGNYKDGRKTTLVPNQWTRISITLKFESEVRPMSFTALNSDNREIPVGTKLYWKNYKIEKGNIATDYSLAPEDNYTQSEFSIFESTYKEDVKGINSTLTDLSNKKLDGSTYTTFYNNEYKKTAQGVTDTFTKVNKIIDANGNSTDAFAKAVYDKNATRQSADFKSVTDGLVKTATYESGINGVKQSITSVQGKIDDLSKARNLLKQSWHNSADSPAIVNTNYGIKSWDLEKPLELGKTYTFRLFGFTNRERFRLFTPNGMRVLGDGMSNDSSNVIRKDNPYNGLKNRSVWEVSFTITQDLLNNMTANKVALYNYPSSNSGNGEVYWATLVEGSTGIDWSPSLTDNLGKADFQVFKNTYESNDKTIKSRLTAIDSGKAGSVIYNANEALKTAKGNTSSITSLNTKVDNLKIGGRNLISGTDDLTNIFGSGYGGSTAKYYKDYAVSASEWGKYTKATRVVITSASGTSGVFTTANHFKMIYGKPYTLSFYIKNLGQNRIQFNLNGLMVNPDGTGSQSIYVNGGESGKFSATGYMRNNAEWNWFQILPAPKSGITSMDFAIAYLQVEEGNFATDWTPALSDQMGKAEFTLFKNEYDSTSKSILNRLTAIDSSASGSVVTRLNKTESTANGNSQLISTINKNYVKQSNIDESILADKQIKDTRNTNQLPSWYYTNYPKQQVREFKTTAVMGIGSGTYGVLITDVQWSDKSGGTVKQSFETDSGIHTRQGNSAGTAWGAWVKQIDTADTTYQKITQTSSLYERVIGSTEANVKSNMARIVMSDSSFQTEIVDKQDLKTAMASGTGMTSDPYFKKGTNGLGVYDNGKTNTITVKRTKIPSTTSIPAPKGSGGYRLDITHKASSATSPYRGGIVNQTNGWANGTVVVKFTAYLPAGRSFSYHNNGLGTGYTHGWLTDNKGTGKWETYMYYYRFGTGTVSNFGHLSVTGSSSAFTWYLSEYDIINVNETSASKITQLADNINLKVSKGDISNQININPQGVVIKGNKIALSGDTTVDGTFWTKQVNAIKVNASNITTGTLNASKVKVINLDASRITGNLTEFIKTNWNQATGGGVTITGSGVRAINSEGSRVTLENGVVSVGNRAGVNLGFFGDHVLNKSATGTMTITASHGTETAFISATSANGKTYKRSMSIMAGAGEIDMFTTLDMGQNPIRNVQNVGFNGGEIRARRNGSAGYMTYDTITGHAFSVSGTDRMSISSVVHVWSGIDMHGKDIASVGKLTYNSDQRLKTNIKDTNIRALDAIRNWQLVSYDWLESGEHVDIGLIAQNTPEVMIYNEENDIYGIDAGKQTMINTLAIQQLDSKVDNTVEQLEAKIASLQEELATLKGD